MAIGFVICSIVAVIFFGIGISCCKSREAVGFFTFVKPPTVENVEHYNRAVSVLWVVVSIVFELISVPFLFLEQNSPIFLLMAFAMLILVIGMMIAYSKIEAKYRE